MWHLSKIKHQTHDDLYADNSICIKVNSVLLLVFINAACVPFIVPCGFNDA